MLEVQGSIAPCCMGSGRSDRSLFDISSQSCSKHSRFANGNGLYQSSTRLAVEAPLQETRQHDISLLLVLVGELLSVGLFLAPAPDVHVVRADNDEDY